MSQALKRVFTQTVKWLEWTEFSIYRAGLFLYLTLKIPALTGELDREAWSHYEPYYLGLCAYLQLLVTPGRLPLLILSPILLISALYLAGLKAALPLDEMSLVGVSFMVYCLLVLIELPRPQLTRHRPERVSYEIKRPRGSISLVSQLRGLSLESLTLLAWVTVSPLALLILSPPHLSFTSLRTFTVSFPYLLFLFLVIGAALRRPPSAHPLNRGSLSQELKRHLTISLILCTLLSLSYLPP